MELFPFISVSCPRFSFSICLFSIFICSLYVYVSFYLMYFFLYLFLLFNIILPQYLFVLLNVFLLVAVPPAQYLSLSVRSTQCLSSFIRSFCPISFSLRLLVQSLCHFVINHRPIFLNWPLHHRLSPCLSRLIFWLLIWSWPGFRSSALDVCPQ